MTRNISYYEHMPGEERIRVFMRVYMQSYKNEDINESLDIHQNDK